MIRYCFFAAGITFSLFGLAFSVESQAATKPPNIILFLADDLGYGELGCYGQKKIRTPHLDRMAEEGMRFTQHYAGAPVCAPSRCVLMTGLHLGHAAVRNNRAVPPEGQTPIPDKTVTIAELLKRRGYATAAIGKWGLGPPGSEGDPNRQGFDLFFGYNCQSHAHNYYPTYLWRNDKRIALDNPRQKAHQRLPKDADPNDPSSYARYIGKQYAPDLMLEEALRFVRNHRDEPFFLYYPTPVPHLAIQVPEDSLAKYRGKWPDPPYPGGHGYLPHPFPRAGYAAMVTRMDRDLGQIMALLEELGLDQNTLFLFTSDNGPTYNRLGGSDSEFFHSAAGMRGLKGSVYEGGIRVPLIARWPGKIAPGRVSDHLSAFWDILPTLMEAAGTKPPADIDGISFLSTLLERDSQQRHDFLLWEFYGYGGQQAVRMGDWKAIRLQCHKDPKGPLELYHLQRDPAETKNVAADHPELVAKAARLMESEHRDHPLWRFGKKRKSKK